MHQAIDGIATGQPASAVVRLARACSWSGGSPKRSRRRRPSGWNAPPVAVRVPDGVAPSGFAGRQSVTLSPASSGAMASRSRAVASK